MIKKVLPFLLIPLLLYSAEVTKKYSFNTPVIDEGKMYMNGCRLNREAFAPCVAVKPVKLFIPYGHEVVSFNVTYGEPVLMDGEYSLVPFRPCGRRSFKPPKDYYSRLSEVYTKNSLYPAAVRSQDYRIQYKNGFPIFLTMLKPAQYNATTGKIQYFTSMTVSVQTQASRAPLPKYHCTPFTKGYLKLLVDNPEAIDNLPVIQKDADDYEYLIVASSSLVSAYSSFVEFNKRRCLRTKVVDISDATSGAGTDAADKLRNFIRTQYNDHNIVYVLLGHDANTVPYRGMRAQMYDYGTDYIDDKNIPADMYFACLDGDWKGSNQYYGESGAEDIGFEVFASRFAVDNSTELNNLMNKVIKYSEDPVTGEVQNNMLCGEYAWGPPDHPVECWGKDDMIQLLGKTSKNGYTTTGFGNDWNTTNLFEKDQSWSKSTFMSRVRDNKITWIDHTGHSNATYIIKLSMGDVTNSNFSNADGETGNYFHIYTQGCYPGNFTVSNCIGEQFTAKISNGAVAFIANTRYGLGDDGAASPDGSDGSTTRFQRYFHDAVFGKGIHMNSYSKEANLEYILETDIRKEPYFGQMKYCCYEITVLGDPALSVWTETPKEWSALPTATASNTEFNMETPPFTWVAILGDNDDIITTQLTSYDTASWDTNFTPGNGHCKIDDAVYKTYAQAHVGEQLKVRIKAHNYLPYTGTVTITSVGIENENNLKLQFVNNLRAANGSFKISYTLPISGLVNIAIYNSKGIRVKAIEKSQKAGINSIYVNNLSNGIYYCRLQAKNINSIGKFVVTK
jgi:hypothetical protein